MKASGSGRSRTATSDACWRSSNECGCADMVNRGSSDLPGTGDGVCRFSHPPRAAGARPGRRFRYPLQQRYAAVADLRCRLGQFALFRGGADHCLAGLRRDGCACQIPAARRGDRMNGVEQIPAWAAVLTAVLLFLGAAVTLVGSLGLLRLGSFYERVHAPTLGTTFGTASIALASIIFFSALQTRPVLHELLIVVFVTLTAPVTLTILVRAALFRDTSENPDRVSEQDDL